MEVQYKVNETHDSFTIYNLDSLLYGITIKTKNTTVQDL